jgi:hypothetical protein
MATHYLGSSADGRLGAGEGWLHLQGHPSPSLFSLAEGGDPHRLRDRTWCRWPCAFDEAGCPCGAAVLEPDIALSVRPSPCASEGGEGRPSTERPSESLATPGAEASGAGRQDTEPQARATLTSIAALCEELALTAELTGLAVASVAQPTTRPEDVSSTDGIRNSTEARMDWPTGEDQS